MKNRLGLFILIFPFILHAQETAREYYNLGAESLEDGRFLQSLDYFRGAVEENEFYLDAYLGLAEAYFYLDEWEESLFYIERAKALDQKRVPLMVWEARIRGAQGQLEESQAILSSILETEPHNIEALLAQGELFIIKNRHLRALREYDRVLNADPSNKKALIAKVMILNQIGQNKEAQSLLTKTLRYHSYDSYVFYFAALYYFNTENYSLSLSYIDRALALRTVSDFLWLKSNLFLGEERYQEAAEIYKQLMMKDPKDPSLRYHLGLTYYLQGQYDQAVSQWSAAIEEAPEDDLIRFSVENLVYKAYPGENAFKKRLAQFHFDKGRQKYIENQFETSIQEFRQGLILEPSHIQGNISYAKVFKSIGRYARYLEQLKFLDNRGMTDQDEKDEIEIYESLLQDSLAVKTGIDQFYIDKEPYKVGLYTINSGNDLNYYLSEDGLLHVLRNELHYYDHIIIDQSPMKVDSFQAAFQSARKNGFDYFILLNFEDESRIFSLNSSIFLSRTGSKITEFQITRKGNDRVSSSLRKTAAYISRSMPLFGTILKRAGGELILSFGLQDNIEKDMELTILKKGAIKLIPRGAGYALRQEDLLGTVRILETDEKISSGELIIDGPFDLINPGDLVLRLPEEDVKDLGVNNYAAPLYKELLKLR